mmetsp:Transcript_15538/g.31966  ORF Transcript_15538/g.31966 Transcript_15538/m.31966 type:complete len:235 (+) Transcript_15538:490-1194(+)
MCLFLGLYPINASQALKTWRGDKALGFPPFVPRRKEGSLWRGPDSNGMHLQGLRWGGSVEAPDRNAYHSASTFASYGVQQGDRQGLLDALPPPHLDFLRSLLPWSEITLGEGHQPYHSLLAVHAGLEIPGTSSMVRVVPSVADQLSELEGPMPALSLPWIEQIQGRDNTFAVPEELEKQKTLLVSGHHGRLDLSHDFRWIIDNGADDRPLAAVVLPDQIVVKSDGSSYRRGATE